MERSNTAATYVEKQKSVVVDNWDAFLVLGFLIFLAVDAAKYGDIARQFPMTFLLAAIAFLLVHLIIQFSPERYTSKFDRFTGGLVENVDIDLDDELPDEAHDTDASHAPRSRIVQKGVFATLVILFGVSSMLIGFLYSIPLFIFVTIYAVGSKNYLRALILTIILTVAIYYLFGTVMNTPITEGILIG